MADRPLAVIGGGSIGGGFAIVFATAGRDVAVCEPVAERRDDCRHQLEQSLADLQQAGLLDEDPATVLARIRIESELGDALREAEYIQECVPEKLPLKRQLFARLDELATADAIIASASSALPVSEISAGLAGAARCLVAHPGNPPFLIRVVELVPGPATSDDCLQRSRALFESLGLAPVVVRRELPGFVFNRLQGAMLREAYCLVRDGVASVEDIDRLVRDGLGLRWSVIGPFETVDLNTRGGIERHAELLGPAYAAMGAERGQDDPWTPEMIAEVTAARRHELPLEQWQERVRWRDRALMALLKARRQRGAH